MGFSFVLNRGSGRRAHTLTGAEGQATEAETVTQTENVIDASIAMERMEAESRRWVTNPRAETSMR